jgi:hypothetical protein
MSTDTKSCGVFRRCTFPDGSVEWVVTINHLHSSGDRVLVAKRDGTTAEIVLGGPLTVILWNKTVENCFSIAQPILRAVSADVAELEKLYRR